MLSSDRHELRAKQRNEDGYYEYGIRRPTAVSVRGGRRVVRRCHGVSARRIICEQQSGVRLSSTYWTYSLLFFVYRSSGTFPRRPMRTSFARSADLEGVVEKDCQCCLNSGLPLETSGTHPRRSACRGGHALRKGKHLVKRREDAQDKKPARVAAGRCLDWRARRQAGVTTRT